MILSMFDLLIKNGLVDRADCEHIRYKTTTKGEAALGHMRELEKMMPEGEMTVRGGMRALEIEYAILRRLINTGRSKLLQV
jgi:hypothetical protein